MFDIEEFLTWCYDYKSACDSEATTSYENECYSVAIADVISKIKRMTES